MTGNRLLLALCLLMPFAFNLTLLPLALLAVFSFWQYRNELGSLLKERGDLPLVLLLAWSLAITPWTIAPGRHLYGWLVQMLGMAVVYALLRLRVKCCGLRPDAVLKALLLGGTGICLLGWLQYANLGFVIHFWPLPPSDGLWGYFVVDAITIPVRHAHARVYSLFYAPPMLGVYLSLLLPLGLYLLQQARQAVFKVLWAINMLLLLSVLLLSFTRIAWIAAALTLPLFLLAHSRRRDLGWMLGGLGLLAAVSLAWPPIWQHVWQRLEALVSLEHHSSAGRIEIWQRSWRAALSDWNGSGLLSFWHLFPDYRWRWPHAHSLVLQQWLEIGLPGLLLWHAWLAGHLRRMGRDPLSWSIGCSLLAWLICGWADDPAFEPRNRFLFWVLSALLAAVTPVAGNPISQVPPSPDADRYTPDLPAQSP